MFKKALSTNMKINDIIIEREILINMYTDMLRIRKFEQKVVELLLRGIPVAWVHEALGQEAVTAGSISALNENDYVLPHLRGWGYYLCKGVESKKIMAELLHKETGLAKGKSGTQFGCIDKRVLGKSGVIGAGIAVGTGVSLSCKLLNTNNVCLIFFGDGGSNTGYCHEAMVMAGAWKLPAIYLCENNQYMMATRFHDVTATNNIADRAIGYGFPGVIVDGNDVLDVYKSTLEAVNRAKEGLGPTLLEAKTYRWSAHFYGRKTDYRPKEEEEIWEKRDPIKLFKLKLQKMDICDDDGFNTIELQINEEMEDAAKYAIESPYPKPESIFDDVLTDYGGV